MADYDFDPFNEASQQQAPVNVDVASILAHLVGAIFTPHQGGAGGMQAGLDYGQGISSQTTSGVDSGLDEYQQSLGKGKTPNAQQNVGTSQPATTGTTRDEAAYQAQRAGERDLSQTDNSPYQYGYF